MKGKSKESNGSKLDLHLFHGDIVVMHGTEIHRCYEVSLIGLAFFARFRTLVANEK